MSRFAVKLVDGTEFEGVRGFGEKYNDGLWSKCYKVTECERQSLIGKRIRCYISQIVYEVRVK